jgi:hypothetical protein
MLYYMWKVQIEPGRSIVREVRIKVYTRCLGDIGDMGDMGDKGDMPHYCQRKLQKSCMWQQQHNFTI